MSDMINTAGSMNDQENNGKALLHRYLIVHHALELQANSSHHRQLKQRMSPEELAVLQYMQKHLSHKKHTANKQDGQVASNNRGRKKNNRGHNDVAVDDTNEDSDRRETTIDHYQETTNDDATTQELPPSYPS